MIMSKWVNDHSKSSCPSCTAAVGQVHPVDVWVGRDLSPGCHALLCGVACTCRFESVEAEIEVGNLEDIPVVGNNQHASVRLSGEVNTAGEFEVLAITSGVGNGWEFGEEVLRESLGLWEGAECFVNHSLEGRSIRDLAGLCQAPAWNEQARGIQVKLRAMGPSAGLLDQLGREVLAAKGARRPRVGFSADVVFVADGKRVTRIVRVNSLDLVFNPARGGAFVRALNAVPSRPQGGPPGGEAPRFPLSASDGENLYSVGGLEDVDMSEEKGRYDVGTGAGAGEGGFGTRPYEPARTGLGMQMQDDLNAARSLLAVQQEKDKLTAEANAAREVRTSMCGYLLESGLAAAKLPQAMAEHVRKQFQGKVFDAQELDGAITSARSLVGELMAGAVVQGPGRINAMFDSKDQLQAAVSDLFEVERDAGTEKLKVARLSGIRELYLMLTGDIDLHGGYDRARVQLATTADFTGLVKNALNKIVINTWDQMGLAGYNWWERIVQQEHFQSLNDVTGILVGTVGDLPLVAEGGEYTELAVGDSPEVASFKKYGGYVPLTLELIDRDNTRKLKAYARELGTAGLRKISSLVAAIFTANTAVGPTMADGGALFNATAVTTAGGHANLLTTALAAAQWDVVGQAMFNQPALVKQGVGYYGTGPKIGVNPKYLLVPRALMLTGKQILYPGMERASNIMSENMQQGAPGDVIVVPEWTDATDYAAVADPRILPGIYVGDRFGIRPEIFIAGDELSPAVFMNDESRMKVRHFLAVWVNDFRPLHKSNVAG